MPIAGVIIMTEPRSADQVLSELQAIDGVQTYGIHKQNNIVAVFDTNDAAELKNLSERIRSEISGVAGVYLSNVNYEEPEI